jgi:hypothetical protein
MVIIHQVYLRKNKINLKNIKKVFYFYILFIIKMTTRNYSYTGYTGPNSTPVGINVKVNKKTYSSKCYKANILEIANNPQLDISSNVLYLKVNFIYLDPNADPCNPLNYLIVDTRKLAIDASNIFSIGNLQTAIENMYNLTPLETEWNNKDEYYMYNLTSYNNINYESIIDTNKNNQPDLSTFYSNAWAPYYNNSISYVTGNCVYYPYTFTYIGPTGCTGYYGPTGYVFTGCTGATGFINPTGYTGPTGSYSFTTNYLYICTTNSSGGNTPPPPTSSSLYWKFYSWNYSIEYNLNEQTTYYSRNYLSIQSSNKNNEPNNSPSYWTEIWSSLVTYNIYDIILYSGTSTVTSNTITYMAITPSNINQVPSNSSLYWAPIWISGNSYVPYNFVYYTDVISNVTSVYICINSTTSTNPPVTSTITSGIIVNTYNSNWQPYIWVSDYTYIPNSIVSYYGILYSCIVSNSNHQPDISISYWAKQYSMYKVYNITDLVYYGTSNPVVVYMSLINVNQNKNPSTDITSWTPAFVSGALYSIGAFVYYTDLLIYVCKNNTSGSENPTNSNYWQPYIWNISSTNPCPSYSFNINNIVYYTEESQNYTQTNKNCTVTSTNTVYYRYKSFLSLTNSNLNNIPGSLTSIYWANEWYETVLYSSGDIVYYNDTENNKGNLAYQSLQDNNINQNPADENTYWKLYTSMIINI